MKILLTGAKGQLGRCFQDRVPVGWILKATDSDTLDITNQDEVIKIANEFKPDVIINAAAYTAVDKAETEKILAERVNSTGPRNLAEAAKSLNSKFVHISTDYVFDGYANEPYIESSTTNPLSVYGITKLEGEAAVLQAYPQAIIIRTAWVFSEYGNNFVKTMIRHAKERDTLSVVDDQFGCPTYAGDIAQAIIEILKFPVSGIFHYCGDKKTSWDEFAKIILDKAFEYGNISKIPIIKSISTEQFPTPAQRPKFSLLCCDKICLLGIKTSDWSDQLSAVIKKLVI